MIRFTCLVLAAFLLITVTACEESPADDRAEADAVGYTVLESTTVDGHAMPVHVWYPGTASDGAAAATYMEGIMPGVTLDGDALVDIRAGTGSFPVLLYSHGVNGHGDLNPFLVEPLAAAGWIVTAPDHIGSLFEDQADTIEGVVNTIRRPDDLGRALALVSEAGADEESPLALAVDAERVIVVGHSMGAATVLHMTGWGVEAALFSHLCETTPGYDTLDYCEHIIDAGSGLVPMRPAGLQIAGAVTMAPGADLFPDEGVSTVDMPLLNVGGSLDTVCPMPPIEEMTETIPGPAAMASLDGANHYSFCGACDLFDYSQFSDTAATECAVPGRLGDQQVIDLMLGLVDEWAAWHLDGDSGARGRLESLSTERPWLSLSITP